MTFNGEARVSTPKLGRLERIDLRNVWETEAGDFTPWLASEDNLALLGDAIGIELEHEATEKNVGPFRADILCRDTATGQWVLIENQLGRTDHTHLGQLLTYAAGLNAVTIVWIAYPFTEEHRAALDWLNEITDDTFNFFGLEVEVWRIGQSEAAPKFNIISKPNDWSKTIAKAATTIANQELSDTKQLQHQYWQQFRDLLLSTGSSIRPQKPYPQHWMNFGIGKTGIMLGAILNSMAKRIGVELYISSDDALAYFKLLEQQKDQIEHEIGAVLDWNELPERKASRIILFRDNCDPLNQSCWTDYHQWMKEKLELFDTVFRQRIKQIDPADWAPEEAGHSA